VEAAVAVVEVGAAVVEVGCFASVAPNKGLITRGTLMLAGMAWVQLVLGSLYTSPEFEKLADAAKKRSGKHLPSAASRRQLPLNLTMPKFSGKMASSTQPGLTCWSCVLFSSKQEKPARTVSPSV
jgi:hypothetical protein